MFEPGDIVEKFKGTVNSESPFNSRHPLPLGTVSCVREVGEWFGLQWIKFTDIEDSDHPTGGWNPESWRVLKRRDPDLIRKLMTEPVQENA